MKRRSIYGKNQNREKKERWVMLASAVFVLTALTMTGVYVRGNQEKEKNDGYTIDFSALEEPKMEERITAGLPEENELFQAKSASYEKEKAVKENRITELNQDDFMDYIPSLEEESIPIQEEVTEPEFAQAAEFAESQEVVETDGGAITQPNLHFSEKDSLTWPIVGNVLINYSMDQTTYFTTLQQYKYSPALVIQAPTGERISAAANGRVIEIAEDEEIGNYVVMDLGDGYQLTYGQLQDIEVTKGAYVSVGETIGNVAEPTKYYSVEGANVYFKLMKDGVPVDPMGQMN